MNLTPEQKQRIDSLGVKELLAKVRFAPLDDEELSGESGEYWIDKLQQLKKDDNYAFVKASKELGWSQK